MIPKADRTPQPGDEQPNTIAPPQQMAAEAQPQPKALGYPPAFGGNSGAAWVFRDLASI